MNVRFENANEIIILSRGILGEAILQIHRMQAKIFDKL